jgi:5-hydroxyisourate hydrolase
MADGEGKGRGRLTTHVLDTTAGRPAAGLALALFALEANGERNLLARATTNADGRLDAPLLGPGTIRTGRFELVFEVAAYFRARGVVLPDPPFLETVPIRFGIADADAHYHVPLLVSPYGYTTYRGS